MSETIPLMLQTPEFIESWRSFVEHRRQMKRQMTDEAERRILRLCSSWGEWYSRVLLDMAIVHGWQKPVEPEGFRTHEYNGFKFTWRGPFRYDEKADDGGGFYYFPTAHGRRLGGR